MHRVLCPITIIGFQKINHGHLRWYEILFGTGSGFCEDILFKRWSEFMVYASGLKTTTQSWHYLTLLQILVMMEYLLLAQKWISIRFTKNRKGDINYIPGQQTSKYKLI